MQSDTALLRYLKFDLLLPLIFLVGIAQYGFVAFDAIAKQKVALFNVDSEELVSSGILRYVKEIFLLLISAAWPLALTRLNLPSGLRKWIGAFYIWIAVVVSIGSLGFIFGYSPISFLPAGLRWILLLNASFGIFILSRSLVAEKNRHNFIFACLSVIVILDAYVIMLQFLRVSSIYALAFGSARLTGLFSSAGVACFFGVAIALVSLILDGVDKNKRLFLCVVAIGVALSSGSRFGTMAVVLILLCELWEFAAANKGFYATYMRLAFIPFFLFVGYTSYQAVISVVDRGNALEQQFEQGGRVSTFYSSLELLWNAEIGEILIGRGLGVGTNTAIGTALSQGLDPEMYRFNILVDNSLLTCTFQFGLLGSMVFWGGLSYFVLFACPRKSIIGRYRFLVLMFVAIVTILAGNPFEHYFLMMSYSVTLGSIYWTEQLTKNRSANR